MAYRTPPRARPLFEYLEQAPRKLGALEDFGLRQKWTMPEIREALSWLTFKGLIEAFGPTAEERMRVKAGARFPAPAPERQPPQRRGVARHTDEDNADDEDSETDSDEQEPDDDDEGEGEEPEIALGVIHPRPGSDEEPESVRVEIRKPARTARRTPPAEPTPAAPPVVDAGPTSAASVLSQLASLSSEERRRVLASGEQIDALAGQLADLDAQRAQVQAQLDALLRGEAAPEPASAPVARKAAKAALSSAAGATLGDRILALLEVSEASVTTIAETLGAPKGSVSGRLAVLLACGEIRRTAPGVYALAVGSRKGAA